MEKEGKQMKVFTQKLSGKNVRVMNYDSDNEFQGAEAEILWGLKIELENELTTVVKVDASINFVTLKFNELNQSFPKYKGYSINIDDSWNIDYTLYPDNTYSISYITVYMDEKLLEVRFN